MLYLSGGDLPKRRRLNPYPRIKLGTTIECVVGGNVLKVLVDRKSQYSYLTIGGVEYYVNGSLTAGATYDLEDRGPYQIVKAA